MGCNCEKESEDNEIIFQDTFPVKGNMRAIFIEERKNITHHGSLTEITNESTEPNDSIKNSTLNDSLHSNKVNRITLNKYKDIFCCEPKVGRRKSTFSKYNDIKISKLSTKLHSDLSEYYLKTESSFKQNKV